MVTSTPEENACQKKEVQGAERKEPPTDGGRKKRALGRKVVRRKVVRGKWGVS